MAGDFCAETVQPRIRSIDSTPALGDLRYAAGRYVGIWYLIEICRS